MDEKNGDDAWTNFRPFFCKMLDRWASCNAIDFFTKFMSKSSMFDIYVAFHGHDAIGFEIYNQFFLTPSQLNKDCWTNYFIVAHNASHPLGIEKIYK
jgi:hypothetical protein